MVRRGWDHTSLMAMSEPDFGFWFTEQIQYDRAEAQARAKANKG